MAVDHAERVLSWQENLVRDEMPPAWMWPLEWELEAWFEDVEARRAERFGGRSGDRDDESGPMIENDLAAAMRARKRAG